MTGRHAVITGGGKGIGVAIADSLARVGVNVTLMGRSVELLEREAARIRAAYDVCAEAVALDVTAADQVERAFATARQRQGDVHILVNNAGVAPAQPFLDITLDLWNDTLAVNLTGAFLCTQAVLPAMIQSGWGRIVNIASTVGLKGAARIAAYAASKHGLIGLTRSVALEVAKQGITVNAVCPGYTDTGMAERAVAAVQRAAQSSEADARARITRVSPLGRLLRPEEVADAVLWLCRPDSAAITGQAIVIGGELT
jgi:NAD(P)-dependent dehydrogenase (short-subunit alcohol dehydrogenase family)